MKLLYRDKKELNYAYNINNSPHSSKTKKLSFNSLSKNFYEELINSDQRIKNSRLKLSKIKSNSIKESIYSNKLIPNSWKIMLDYQPSVYKVIDKDPSFAYYLGRSKNDSNDNKFKHVQQLKSVNEPKNFGQKSMGSIALKNFLEEGGSADEGKPLSNNESQKSLEKIDKIIRKKSKMFKGGFNLNFHSNEKILDDKLISSKLDEYRTKYDLNKVMKEIKQKEENDKKKKMANIPIPILQIENKDNNYKQFLKTRTQNDKEHVLKSSIYYNLIAKHNNEKNKTKKIYKKIDLQPIQKENIFLFHNTEFDKVIEITNPKIKRDLELINYYGPRYTHCKLCNNRNLEFYKNSEPNQTLKLLHYLKKVKLVDKDEKDDNKS